jgi:hypothetical protein
MKVKVIKPFNDKTDNLAFREVGTELEVDNDRGAYLVYKGFAELVNSVSEQETPQQENAEPEQPKRKGRKKTEQTN